MCVRMWDEYTGQFTKFQMLSKSQIILNFGALQGLLIPPNASCSTSSLFDESYKLFPVPVDI